MALWLLGLSDPAPLFLNLFPAASTISEVDLMGYGMSISVDGCDM